MSWIAIIYYIFMFVWIFGGIALFTYVKWGTIKRKQQEFRVNTRNKLAELKNATLSLLSFSLNVMFILAPFLIPLAVTALTFIFE